MSAPPQALLDLEKTNGHGKQDRLAAVRAEKMRHSTKAEFRRNQNRSYLADLRDREKGLLVLKHAIPDPVPTGTWAPSETGGGVTVAQMAATAGGGKSGAAGGMFQGSAQGSAQSGFGL